MYSSWSEIAVRIIEKFVMIHLGPIKTFLAKVQILCSKSLLIAYLKGWFWDGFENRFYKIIQKRRQKRVVKFYSKLIKCFGTYFSLRNLSIDQCWINYFFFIIILIFFFFVDLFADIFKFFKCRLFIKHSRKSTENGYEHWEITETNNWIRLLDFDDNS